MISHFCSRLFHSVPIESFTPVRAGVISSVSLFLFVSITHAQSLDDNSQGAVELVEPASGDDRDDGSKAFTPPVGRKAAEKYMAPRRSSTPVGALGPDSHYLALHLGGYASDDAYKWGDGGDMTNIGSWNVGVTYRVGEWKNSMDLGIRLDLSNYKLEEGRSSKLSFLPVITFPDASSRFPLYFGGAIGPGVFIKQVAQESSLSLDYQIFAGARFFDIFGSTGFFIEGGLKNHLLLLSDGQFNGTFVVLGALFTF